MNNPRMFLMVALLALGYLVWSQWQIDYGPQRVAPAPVAATTDDAVPVVPEPSADVPTAIDAATPPAPVAPGSTPATVPSLRPIVVTTDLLRVEIDPRGGSVVGANLLAYPQQPKAPETVRLFDTDPARFYVAQSGLVSSTGTAPDHNATFTAENTEYALADGETRLEVPLTWTDANGLSVRKTFVFERGSYVIEQQQQISNRGATAWSGNAYTQLQRVPQIVDRSGLKTFTNTEAYSFSGAAWYSPQDKFQKLKYDDFVEEPLQSQIPEGKVTGGWIAMLQHYFFAAWIPPAAERSDFSSLQTTVNGATRYVVRSMSPAIRVEPGADSTHASRLYVGPKLQSTLDEVTPGLALTVDYGMFTVISTPLHWLLAQLHKLTGNWGFAIILLVLLIKAAMFKLSEAQYKSMAKMRKMQPRMVALKERYGDDKQKLNQAMLEFYKKEKINPLGGCLPMLVQMPIFLALYWVLLESVELRQAPFILWIQNLTAPDPYFVLPVLNAAAMLATQHLTPMTGMDPLQAKMMKFMPVIFSVLFAFFPAGLVLYWTVNGVLSLAQQWFITKRIENADKAIVPAKAK